MRIDTAVEVLMPSWWEVQVTMAASVFVIVAYWFFSFKGRGVDRSQLDNSSEVSFNDNNKVVFLFKKDFFFLGLSNLYFRLILDAR